MATDLQNRIPAGLPNRPGPPPLIVVMGVSGAGKSTFGSLLARRLGVRFVDGDDLHPAANVAKMAAGQPLDDADRWPWLARVAQVLADASTMGLVVACSALKRSYRAAILSLSPDTLFVLLDAPRDVLLGRLRNRHGHFMPADLLDSQLATLEPLQVDEPGFVISSNADPATQVAETMAAIRVKLQGH